jgi:glycosyltransferase involved in cell wall biosynthesis
MKNLKIACYGYVDKNGGSIGKAFFIILQELLSQGMMIDFFGWRGFNCATELEGHPNFRYIDLPSPPIINPILAKLPEKLRNTIYPGVNLVANNALHFREIRRTVEATHRSEKYTAMLFLGIRAPFRIQDLPNISWGQGAPGVEWKMIQKHRTTVVKYCGELLYEKLKIYAFLKRSQKKYSLFYTDIALCASHWTKDRIVEAGLAPEKVYVMPYPQELDRFACKTDFSNNLLKVGKTLLHLGRLDPRKRLDLLLDAFILVLKERKDVKLKIVGSFTYNPGYRKMIEDFPFPESLEYCPFVPQAEVPKLIQECDVLVQPSEAEEFGSAVAEALCCGLPVVVGMTNGTKDYLGQSSFIFDEYTPESLKSKILEALDVVSTDPQAQAKLAREAAEKYLNVDGVASQIRQIIFDLSQDKNRSTQAFSNQLVESKS